MKTPLPNPPSSKSQITCIGVGVAKATLALDGPRLPREVPNSAAGHQNLLRLLPPQAHVILEASGGYERPLVLALHAAGVALSVPNARQARDFARARGLLAKTDQIDAAMLTAFGACLAPAADLAPSAAQIEMAELVGRRAQLVAWRVAERNRAEHHTLAPVRAQARRLERRLDKEIAQMEGWIATALAADEALRARNARLQEVAGVGPVAAASLLGHMLELGTLTPAQAAALVGGGPLQSRQRSAARPAPHPRRTLRPSRHSLHGRAHRHCAQSHP